MTQDSLFRGVGRAQSYRRLYIALELLRGGKVCVVRERRLSS